jgi:outer membrane immunogenic protein
MKTNLLATCAIASLCLVASANRSDAQSNEDMLRRLEAKIDALSKENASLRSRMNKLESPRAASASVTPSTTVTAAGTPVPSAAREAYAANLPVKAYPAPRPGCAQFGGWYVGGNVGWGVYDTAFSDRNGLKDTLDSGLPDNVDGRKQGVTAGAQGGYNWQSGCSLLGIETDWSWSGLKTSEFLTDGDLGTQDTLNVENRLRWFGTTRARAGVVVDNLLLYVTGGLAYANFRRNYAFFQDGPAHTNVFSSDNTKLGWVAGAGAEWALPNNWTLKGEFLYMSFEGDRVTVAGDGNGIGNAGVNYRLDSQESLWVSRIGLNYRFGGDAGKGPVVAKY